MLRVRTTGTGWTGGPGLHTAYFVGATEDPATALDCVGRVRAAFVAGAGLFVPSVRWQTSGEVDIIDSVTGQITGTLAVATPAVVPGTAASADSAPFATAILLRLLTSAFSGGRRIQGRSFLSPVAIASVAAGSVVGPTFVAAAQAFGAAISIDVGAPADLVVWRRPRLANPGAIPPVSARAGLTAVVTSYAVPTKFAVLRSRRD